MPEPDNSHGSRSNPAAESIPMYLNHRAKAYFTAFVFPFRHRAGFRQGSLSAPLAFRQLFNGQFHISVQLFRQLE